MAVIFTNDTIQIPVGKNEDTVFLTVSRISFNSVLTKYDVINNNLIKCLLYFIRF